MKRKRLIGGAVAAILLILVASMTLAQAPEGTNLGTAITYQGYLKSGDVPVDGECDLQFRLWDAETDGSQIGPLEDETGVSFSHGLFTLQLDFGEGAFRGEARWLEIAVRCPDDPGYVTLTPRQALTAAPYALALPGLWTQQNITSTNLIGGYGGNWLASGVFGATIAGGGRAGDPNRVTDRYGTIGGGVGNQAGDNAGNIWEAGFATVGGGRLNSARGGTATIGGGTENVADGWGATIGGGATNSASADGATVAGGNRNAASGGSAIVGGGQDNAASYELATVGGGHDNTASFKGATVGGGGKNAVSGGYSIIGGGWGNTADGFNATVGGGITNTVTADGVSATIGGGAENTVTGATGFIGGGALNLTSANMAAVVGGDSNTASGVAGFVGGGQNNTAGGEGSTIAGGQSNEASGQQATVAGGGDNVASGQMGSIGGGGWNIANGDGSFVGGGYENAASGRASTVPGGNGNLAGGNYSFAAGYRAKANNQGCFVWGDATDADVSSSGDRQFIVRANGGLWFGRATTNITPTIGANEFISTSTGAYLSTAGEWVSASDRNAKENLAPVDTGRLLARLSQVPVTTWNHTVQDPSIRHIGPMAQDFYAAFGVGEDDRHISTVDADGVALAAIQGLYVENQALKAQLAGMEARLSALEQGTAGEQPARTGARLPTPWLLAGGLVVAGGALVGWRRRSRGAR